MRIREIDDLTGVGRICQDFLIARHGRIENDFSDGTTGRADGTAAEQRTVGQGQYSLRPVVLNE